MKIKVCTKCGEEKPATNEYFRKHHTRILDDASTRVYLRSRCKGCEKPYYKQWSEENKEKLAVYSKCWREKNKEKLKKKSKERYKKNGNACRERNRRWRKENPERVAAKNKSYRAKNKEYYTDYDRRRKEKWPGSVYAIKNNKNGLMYIGCTTRTPARFREHKSRLKLKTHTNQLLQRDYNKYGLGAFKFEIIEEHPCEAPLKLLEKLEQETIKRFLAEGKKLYNIVLINTTLY